MIDTVPKISRRLMRPSIGWPLAMIFLLLAGTLWSNGDALEEWIADHAIVIEQEEGPLIGIRPDENWLVVLIDFPDQDEPENCDQQRAANMLDVAANDHLSQTNGQSVNLRITYHDKIISTNFGMATYGSDVDSDRDQGLDGNNPHTLANEIIEAVQDEVEWNLFDLDKDGWVDRFLILHCATPQEDGGGSSSRIWSHFSSTEEVVDLGDGLKIGHYTIASQRSGNNFGTIIHEMYHQLGGLDLYPVHDSTVQQSWKGVGKWDVMASGNWNGNGVWPAVPTSPTKEILGVSWHQDVVLDWLEDSTCSGPDIEMKGISESGYGLKIPIGEDEFVWVELRSDSGYDSHLPGHGILVLQQDLRSGDLDSNLVNSHPERAWLKVIEADGNQDMVKGKNEGTASDLFQNESQFGADGIQIRNRDGILVDWTANISVINGTYSVGFSSEGCGHDLEVDLPDHGSVLTTDDDIPMKASCDGLIVNLNSSDGRNITFMNDKLIFSSPGIKGVIGTISGTITCENNGTPLDILHQFEILGNIPTETKFKATIPYDSPSTLEIPLEMNGEHSQFWLVGLDGPIERIASTENKQDLKDGSIIIVDIDPDGLLSPQMLASGDLILASDSGHQWRIEIELIAYSDSADPLNKWREPATMVPIALLLAALWVILGIKSPTRKVATEHQELPPTQIEGYDPALVDPFSQPDR